MSSFLEETDTERVTNERPTDSLRFMYYNIYGYGDNPAQQVFVGPMEQRQEMQLACIRKYAPDVLGLQEYDKAYRSKMAPRLAAAGYTEVPIGGEDTYVYPAGKNCEAMFCRTDRLTCVCSGGMLYPDRVEVDGAEVLGNNGHSKSLTWAVLEDRQTRKRMIAVDTHFMWSAPELTAVQAEAVRVDNAQRLLRQIGEIRAADSSFAELPVVMGGDLNCVPGSPAFETLCGSMVWAYNAAAGYRDNLGCPGYATYDNQTASYTKWGTPAPGRCVIDYIWVQNPVEEQGFTVQSYFTVTDRYALLSSDHCPKVADVTFRSPAEEHASGT